MRAVFLVAVLVLNACDTRFSVESEFTLAQDSRLPKWAALPAGVRRDEVAVELTFYTVVDPRIEVLKGYWPFRSRLLDITAKRLGGYLEPKKLTVPPSDPRYDFRYEVLVADGVVDIVEHSCRCSEFRMTDDSEVWSQLGQNVTR